MDVTAKQGDNKKGHCGKECPVGVPQRAVGWMGEAGVTEEKRGGGGDKGGDGTSGVRKEACATRRGRSLAPLVRPLRADITVHFAVRGHR